MTAPLVISHYWADEAGNPAIAIRELKQRLTALGQLPEHVTLVSAGEVGILLDPLVNEFHHWLREFCHVSFISAACTSLHAAILDFYHSDLSATVVISLELDKSFQQACLNSLGVGNDSGQDGLDVVPGVGFIALKRSTTDKPPTADELVVQQCQLFSQQGGLSGTQALIHQLYQQLKALPEGILPVSFNISSHWGKSLLLGLNSRLAARQRSVNWLSSIEEDERHYLSLKPLFELQLYQQQLITKPASAQKSLLLFTLGGGGRVGMLQLGNHVAAMPEIEVNPETKIAALPKTKAAAILETKAEVKITAQSKNQIKLPAASFEQQSLEADIRGYQLAKSLLKNDKSAYYQQIRATLKYPHSRYRGRDNHYFKWQIALNSKQG